jgi:hypothetical protein
MQKTIHNQTDGIISILKGQLHGPALANYPVFLIGNGLTQKSL